MSESADSDPERLLAEALRAQARSAPPPPSAKEAETTRTEQQPVTTGGPADEGLPHGYGLLSGTGASSLERERAALDDLPAPAPADEAITVEQHLPGDKAKDGAAAVPLATHWILVLAVVLGLAAGSVVGLLTLL
ncbi:hypothetical protein SAMN05216266_101296 [Amycolatopsis marina]|uniref:Uncharacterized protein n=1 Tax=Amycolatopsis marina TaxID=490629 RepID=A0A1I0VJL8_9PSEU|nr:hypothetical protein [Amycolatopsis marina]SFA76512.1 hypothetical protein SAMN05216266_101296 [Amycolatopsis marina]